MSIMFQEINSFIHHLSKCTPDDFQEIIENCVSKPEVFGILSAVIQTTTSSKVLSKGQVKLAKKLLQLFGEGKFALFELFLLAFAKQVQAILKEHCKYWC